eukprot:3016534-Prymnesium_polylepis.1
MARKMYCVSVVRLALVAVSSEKWSLKMVSDCHVRERKKARERGRADARGDLTNQRAPRLRLGRRCNGRARIRRGYGERRALHRGRALHPSGWDLRAARSSYAESLEWSNGGYKSEAYLLSELAKRGIFVGGDARGVGLLLLERVDDQPDDRRRPHAVLAGVEEDVHRRHARRLELEELSLGLGRSVDGRSVAIGGRLLAHGLRLDDELPLRRAPASDRVERERTVGRRRRCRLHLRVGDTRPGDPPVRVDVAELVQGLADRVGAEGVAERALLALVRLPAVDDARQVGVGEGDGRQLLR